MKPTMCRALRTGAAETPRSCPSSFLFFLLLAWAPHSVEAMQKTPVLRLKRSQVVDVRHSEGGQHHRDVEGTNQSRGAFPLIANSGISDAVVLVLPRQFSEVVLQIDLPNGSVTMDANECLPSSLRAWLERDAKVGLYWCFITADNPAGVVQDSDVNVRAEQELSAEVADKDWTFVTGRWLTGSSKDPDEEGMLIKNIAEIDMVKLMQNYGQALIIQGDMALTQNATAMFNPSCTFDADEWCHLD